MMTRVRLIVMVGLIAAVAAGAQAQVQAQKIVAILDGGWNQSYFPYRFGVVNFFDVTNIETTGLGSPPFSVWCGWEDGVGANKEEFETMTVNPANGTVYLGAYDSGTAGSADSVGDMMGDTDLWKIDYQSILKDFNDNGRAAGTVYMPATGCDGFDYANAAGNDGKHPGLLSQPHVYMITGVITKIGEVARNSGPDYNYPVLQYVNPGLIVAMDDRNTSDPNDASNDFRLVAFERTTTAPTYNSSTREGGWAGAQDAENWGTVDLGLLNMDGPYSTSEPTGMTYVDRDGVQGVWISESDMPSNADDVAFFQITDWTGATKATVTGQFAADATSDPNDNTGRVSWVGTDAQGNVLMCENGYYSVPQLQPQIATKTITTYDSNGVQPGGYVQWVPGADGQPLHPPIVPTVNDNSAGSTIASNYVVYDKGKNQAYIFDTYGNYYPDLYVYDLDNNALVNEELDINNSLGEQYLLKTDQGISVGLVLFCRGDMNGDGLVNAKDIDAMQAMSHGSPSALLQEQFDLTSDANTDNADVAELVESILGTYFGDSTLDGQVTGADLAALATNWGMQSGAGWALGDFNGDGMVSGADLAALATNWNAGSAPSAGAGTVPEPITLSLLALGGMAVIRRRRR